MKCFSVRIAAVLLTLSGTTPVLAGSVSGSCAGSYDASGNFIPGNQGGCDASPPQGSSSGGGVTPGQQMQLDAAYGVGSAVGTAIANWLFAPTPHQDSQKVLQQARQRMVFQNQRRERERIKEQQEHLELLGSTKGTEFTGDLQEKGLDDAVPPPRPLRQVVTAEEHEAVERMKNQISALNCGLEEVLEVAQGLGPEGEAFSRGLADDVVAAERDDLPRRPPDSAPNTCDVVSIHRDSSDESTHQKGGMQLIASTSVTRLRDTGQSVVSIQYEFSKAGEKAAYGQDLIVLGPTGKVDCQDVSPAAAKCLKRAKLAGGIFSRRQYCPHPPPDNFEKHDYPACDSKVTLGKH